MRIVGYTYRAENYCLGCIVAQLTTNPGDVHHSERQTGNTEEHLNLLARLAGIDREDEYTFNSDYFPKVIFSTQVENAEECGMCGDIL